MTETELINLFKILGNRRRWQILRLLKKENECSVGEIAGRIRLSFKATSKHLGLLLRSGLVDYENRQNRVFYYLVRQANQLADLLLKKFV